LPESLVEKFSEASAGIESVQWRARGGTVHSLAVAREASEASYTGRSPTGRQATDTDFALLEDTAPLRMTVAAAVSDEQAELRGRAAGFDSDRLVGTLVHRLLQRLGMVDTPDDAELLAAIDRLVRPEERSDVGEPGTLAAPVIAAYRALCRRPDVRAIYTAGHAIHEVPFTLVDGGRIVRGTIDCLVRSGDRVTVLEFKTGRGRAEHDAQAEFYRKAAHAVFPDAVVDARVVYADANV
jgi:ATP-dependent exoDNAse (exonuclease V) beta subunit